MLIQRESNKPSMIIIEKISGRREMNPIQSYVISARYRARIPLIENPKLGCIDDQAAESLLSEITVEKKSSSYPVEISDVGILHYEQPHFLKNSGAIYLGKCIHIPKNFSKRTSFFTDYESLIKVMKNFEQKNCSSISIYVQELDPTTSRLVRYARMRNIQLPLIAHCSHSASVFTLNLLAREFDQIVIHFDGQTLFKYPKFLKSLLNQGAPISFLLSQVSIENLEKFIVSHELYNKTFPILFSPIHTYGLKTISKETSAKIKTLSHFYQLPIWLI